MRIGRTGATCIRGLALAAAATATLAGCKSLRDSWRRPAYADPAVRPLRVSGSQIPVEVLRSWSEKCRLYNFDLEIVGRTDHNLLAANGLILDQVDLSCISRKFNEVEEADFARRHPGRQLVQTPIAIRAFALYRHPDCPIDVLTDNQVRQLYQGKLRRFDQLGANSTERIHLYGPPRRSPAGHVFASFAKSFIEEPWWLQCKDVEEVCRRVAEDPNGIGFGPIGHGKGLRTMAIRLDARAKAYRPTIEAILDGTYRLGWPIYCQTDGPPTGVAKDLIDWLLSPAGRKVIRKTRPWIPIPQPR